MPDGSALMLTHLLYLSPGGGAIHEKGLTPDVAVEEGVTSTFPDGETLTSLGRYTVLHLKRNGRWLMQSVRVVEEESVSSYGELQSLEWLVGEWIDEGRTEVVESKFRWDENKSFLLEEFQVISQGSTVGLSAVPEKSL